MNQDQRRRYLIEALLLEQQQDAPVTIPQDIQGQKRLLRALFNLRMPQETTSTFLQIQNDYLQTALAEKGITDYRSLTPNKEGFYLWQGDITTLRCDAIVNAANCQMLGCFYPNHGCIDNAIHTFAGIQLRAACARLMEKQGHEEPTGTARITPAYNLPSRYIIHTVGPIVQGELTPKNRDRLASCYRACLEVACANQLESLAFCCLSTGEFHFPNHEAAQIALKTVRQYQQAAKHKIAVIFNVFTDLDYAIYQELLQ